MLEENTQCIASALRNSIINLGKVPKFVYQDNGKAFKAKYFTENGISGLFSNLGIQPIYAKPYNAKAKPVERLFRELQDSFEVLLPSYSGVSIVKKPAQLKRNEKLHKALFKVNLPTIEQVIQALDYWLKNFHYKQPWQNTYALDMNILPEDKITDLLNLCKTKYPEAYPILYISLSTGASIPEILGLTWDRLDFETNTIFLKYFLYGNRLIMNNHASSIRKLKIDSKIADILQVKFNKINPKPTDFVFKFDSSKLPQQYFENVVLKGLLKELCIEKLYPSDLQYNFVNLCLKQNIPLTFIQKSLGYFGIVNFVKTYKNLIEKLEGENYNPLTKIYSSGDLKVLNFIIFFIIIIKISYNVE